MPKGPKSVAGGESSINPPVQEEAASTTQLDSEITDTWQLDLDVSLTDGDGIFGPDIYVSEPDPTSNGYGSCPLIDEAVPVYVGDMVHYVDRETFSSPIPSLQTPESPAANQQEERSFELFRAVRLIDGEVEGHLVPGLNLTRLTLGLIYQNQEFIDFALLGYVSTSSDQSIYIRATLENGTNNPLFERLWKQATDAITAADATHLADFTEGTHFQLIEDDAILIGGDAAQLTSDTTQIEDTLSFVIVPPHDLAQHRTEVAANHPLYSSDRRSFMRDLPGFVARQYASSETPENPVFVFQTISPGISATNGVPFRVRWIINNQGDIESIVRLDSQGNPTEIKATGDYPRPNYFDILASDQPIRISEDLLIKADDRRGSLTLVNHIGEGPPAPDAIILPPMERLIDNPLDINHQFNQARLLYTADNNTRYLEPTVGSNEAYDHHHQRALFDNFGRYHRLIIRNDFGGAPFFRLEIEGLPAGQALAFDVLGGPQRVLLVDANNQPAAKQTLIIDGRTFNTTNLGSVSV